MTGVVHSIESLAAVDGKGLRCCVFLAGCPLRCVYCHNPDTWRRVGKEYSPEDLARKIKRFQPYFGKEGGVTFSGGEPLLQAAFLREMAPLLAKDKIPYILDTSGQVELSGDIQYLLQNAQEVLLDLKFWDDASYLRYTGQDMRKTREMLSYLEEIGKDTVIRTVVVPGINDQREVLARYLPHVKGLSCVKKYELLPFHTMGFFKYENLGVPNPLRDTPPLSPDVCRDLQAFIEQ